MTSLSRKLISFFVLICLSLNFFGCARTKLLGGIDEKGERIFLTPTDTVPDSIEQFMKSQDVTKEDSKINYLLYRIERSKLTFVRNRVNYASTDAADFLRWKLNRPRWRPLVKTAREFIIIITSGSVMSGQPYQIAFPDKKLHHELKPILINELDFLEEYLELKSEEDVKKANAIHEAIQKVAETISEKAAEVTQPPEEKNPADTQQPAAEPTPEDASPA